MTYTVAEQRAIDIRAGWIVREFGVSRAVARECAETELDHGLLVVTPVRGA